VSRVTGSSPALALVCAFPFDLIFLIASFSVAARIARACELALSPVGGFYVLVVMLLTSMKFIIALLVQEVKRYVVISLILFRNLLIAKNKIQKINVSYVDFTARLWCIYATVSRRRAPCCSCRK